MGSILIVDDDYITIDGIRQYVNWERCGVKEVYTAMSARRAKEIIEGKQIDVLVTDIEMPGDSGIDLLKWINEKQKDPICIFLTSHADFSYAREAVKQKAFLYLLKPAPIEEMEEAITSAVEEARKRRKNQMIVQSLQESSNEDDSVEALKKAKKYIAEHISEEISRKEVADFVYLNPDYLSKLLKKETGLSFSEYVMNCRISLAKMLLQATGKSIQEIAGMTGFNSASYFSKIFKQETGISPATFRASAALEHA